MSNINIQEIKTETKEKIKISDIYNSSIYFLPRSLDDKLVDKLTKNCLKLILNLYRYFSTESGKKIQRKEYTTTDLRKLLGVDGKEVARNSITSVVEQLKTNKLFFIFEGFIGKEKSYAFFLKNDMNEKLFKEVELGKKHFNFYANLAIVKNNIIDIETIKEKKPAQPDEEPAQPDEEPAQSIEHMGNSIEQVKNAKTIDNAILKADLKTKQETFLEETYNKEHYIQETSYISKSESQKKEITENKKDVVCGVFKNLNEVEEEKTISEQECLLLDYGVKKEKTSNFDKLISLPKEFIVESINKVNERNGVKNKPSYLVGMLNKKSFGKENVSEIVVKPEVIKPSTSNKDKLVKFLVSLKKMFGNDAEEACKVMLNWAYDKKFMNTLKELGLNRNDLEELFNYVASTYPTFRNYIAKIKDFWAYYDGTKNFDDTELTQEQIKSNLNKKIVEANLNIVRTLDKEIPC